MNEMIHNLIVLVKATQVNVLFVLWLLGIMWAINFINWFLLGSLLNIFGILPRNLFGLLGIVFSPILHANFNHLFFNTFPLFIFANLVLLGGKALFFTVTIIILIVSGLLVWLVGRRAIHIGASGLLMGYWSYLLFNAFKTRSSMAIVLGFVTIYYFGGMVMDLFPEDRRVSMEGHICGFLGGIAAIYLTPMIYPVIVSFIS